MPTLAFTQFESRHNVDSCYDQFRGKFFDRAEFFVAENQDLKHRERIAGWWMLQNMKRNFLQQ